jgi:hypothetical protein
MTRRAFLARRPSFDDRCKQRALRAARPDRFDDLSGTAGREVFTARITHPIAIVLDGEILSSQPCVAAVNRNYTDVR